MLELIAVVTITVLAVISPGADFAMVTRNSLVLSRRAGVLTALGIGAGVLVHVAYSLMGVGLVISQSILLLNFLKIIGAIYLLWLGVMMLRAQPHHASTDRPPSHLTDGQALKLGFLTNATNPKTTLFVLSVFIQVVAPDTPLAVQIGYGLFMSVAHILWFTLVALFFSNSSIRSRIIGYRHWLERVFGAALALFGLSLAYSTLGQR
jgi:RhtB (resistance to homoserine/threonine) family protein